MVYYLMSDLLMPARPDKLRLDRSDLFYPVTSIGCSTPAGLKSLILCFRRFNRRKLLWHPFRACCIGYLARPVNQTSIQPINQSPINKLPKQPGTHQSNIHPTNQL